MLSEAEAERPVAEKFSEGGMVLMTVQSVSHRLCAVIVGLHCCHHASCSSSALRLLCSIMQGVVYYGLQSQVCRG
jgi:hypothetical protein